MNLASQSAESGLWGRHVESSPKTLWDRIEPGSMRWRRWPAGDVGSIAVPHEDALAYLARGWVSLNGIRASVKFEEREPYCTVLRLRFEQLWPYAHP